MQANDLTRTVNFSQDTDQQKDCSPGPKVIFPKGSKQVIEYLENYTKENYENCEAPYSYPKYIEGKYCCSEDMVTEQEVLDYLNMLLESALLNVTSSVFHTHMEYIRYLILFRENLLKVSKEKGLDLVDNFDYKIFLNFGIISEREKKPFNTWFTIMLASANSHHQDYEDREKFGQMTREQRKERNLAVITGPEVSSSITDQLQEAKIQESICPSGSPCVPDTREGNSRLGGSRRRKSKKRKGKKHSNKLCSRRRSRRRCR